MNECLIQERCKDDSDEVLPSLQAPKSLPQCSMATHTGQEIHSGEGSTKPAVDVPRSCEGS